MSSSNSSPDRSPQKSPPLQTQKPKDPTPEKKQSNPFFQYVPHQSSQNLTEKIKKPEEDNKTQDKKESRKEKHSSSSKSPSYQRERSRNKHEGYSGRQDQGRPWKNDRDSESYRNDTGPGEGYRKFNFDNRGKNDQQKQFKDYRKTKLCPGYQNGNCRKGYECNFAHGENELKILPNYRKTKLCLAFKEGKCGRLSSQCKYAHGEGELRKAPDAPSQERYSRQRKIQKPKKQYRDYDRDDYRAPPSHNYQSNYPPQYPPYPNHHQYGGMPPPMPQPYYYYQPPQHGMRQHNNRSSSPNEYENPMYYPPPPSIPNQNQRGLNPNSNSMPMPYPPPPYEYYDPNFPNYRYPPKPPM